MRRALATALRRSRKSRGLTQEDFSVASSRTYLSSLERGLKSPTIDKLHAISDTLGIHLVSLMALTCMYFDKEDNLDALLIRVRREVEAIKEKASAEEKEDQQKGEN